MEAFKKRDIAIPYKGIKEEDVSNYELINSLIQDLEQEQPIQELIYSLKEKPPINFNTNYYNYYVIDAITSQLHENEESISQINYIPLNLRSKLEDYLDKDLTCYYYLDSFNDFFDVNSLPMQTSLNKEEKILQYYLGVFNQLFKPLKKKYVNGVYYIKLPDVFVDNYNYFLNNMLYLKEDSNNQKLYYLVFNYFKNILYRRHHNFTLSETFMFTGLGKQVKYNEETNVLSIEVKSDVTSYTHLSKTTNHYIIQIWLFAAKTLTLFTTMELISLLRNQSTLLDVTNYKEEFLPLIKDRRIPLTEVKHKSAVKKAKNLGMTHLFLPLDEETIPINTPFSLKLQTTGHSRIVNLWTIVPPSNNLSVIKRYVGHNNNYSDYTTLNEPHLVGDELLKVKFDDNFYYYLARNYDWEYKKEMLLTLDLIKQHPRLKNDLISLSKESELND